MYKYLLKETGTKPVFFFHFIGLGFSYITNQLGTKMFVQAVCTFEWRNLGEPNYSLAAALKSTLFLRLTKAIREAA